MDKKNELETKLKAWKALANNMGKKINELELNQKFFLDRIKNHYIP